MANQRNTNRRRPPQRSSSRPQSPSRNPRRRSQRKSSPGFDLGRFLQQIRPKPDFKPDVEESKLMKLLYLTQVQRDRLTKWGLYIALILGFLMIQDVIMSQISIFGATTDLAVCVILLITVIEGIEVGSVFVLLASSFYYFAGTAPGPYTVALLTFLGIGACLFRQMYWHRNAGSIILCSGIALMVYEIATFCLAVLNDLTRWDRLMHFVVTGLLSVAVMIPLYSLINVIGQIGGNTWKE